MLSWTLSLGWKVFVAGFETPFPWLDGAISKLYQVEREKHKRQHVHKRIGAVCKLMISSVGQTLRITPFANPRRTVHIPAFAPLARCIFAKGGLFFPRLCFSRNVRESDHERNNLQGTWVHALGILPRPLPRELIFWHMTMTICLERARDLYELAKSPTSEASQNALIMAQLQRSEVARLLVAAAPLIQKLEMLSGNSWPWRRSQAPAYAGPKTVSAPKP
jgi:hypothetical protein